MQEIANLCGFFRWHYDCESIMFSSTKDCVNAEEGFLLQPQKTLEEFDEAEYECLILPGCSQPICLA